MGRGRPDRYHAAVPVVRGPPTVASTRRPSRAVDRTAPAEEFSVLEIEVATTDAYTLCRPVGELDAYTVNDFREALGAVTGADRVLIDLSNVPFMDSAGLGALIGGIRRTRESGGEVAVACGRPTLTRLLHTTGFDRIVPVEDTLESAAAVLAAVESS